MLLQKPGSFTYAFWLSQMNFFLFSHKGKGHTKGAPRQANGKALEGMQCVLASTLLPRKLSLCLHVTLGMKYQC